MYFVYVLKSHTRNFHYIGHTKNIQQRVRAHNAGRVRLTKAYHPYTVIYSESYSTKSEAAKREYYLKSVQGNIVLRNTLKTSGVW